ncbi:MAG: alpha-glucosidase/alpha-galactosidase [Planctomycetota bacterium]|nr:alpha-glucosidase/alpha-galactosidase [Planctomycetota bacterium]
MAKITFIGGGSAKFVSGLVRDLFTFETLRDSRIALMDINSERMERSARLIRKMIADLKLPATVETTTDQARALHGADYVIVTVMVGGFKHYESDGAIPVKYGVLPTVGDTIGPGAVMRLIRTAPVVQEIVRNLKRTAPNAWVFNYTNPMAMITWMFLASGHEQTVGLCHSIQGSYRQIADFLGIPPDEVVYTAGGINHIDFYLTITHRGQDLYPRLLAKKAEILAKHPDLRVKFELLESLGAWPAEGQHHQTEYYPWFRKTRQMGERDYAVETMWGYHFDKRINGELDAIVENQIAGREAISYTRSHEFGAWMIDSIQTDTQRLVYGNVRNRGLIENLPPQAVVEVPCHVDACGVRPCRVGALPLPLAAVMTPHILLHEMAIQATLNKDRRMIRQAIQADPMTGAVLTVPQIRQLTDELMDANAEYMHDWPRA